MTEIEHIAAIARSLDLSWHAGSAKVAMMEVEPDEVVIRLTVTREQCRAFAVAMLGDD